MALANKIVQLGDSPTDLAINYNDISQVHALAGERSRADEYRIRADMLANRKQGAHRDLIAQLS